MTFKELVEKIEKIQPKHTQLLIGIDGGGGAGKTTFATKIADMLGAEIIHLDDLYKQKKDRVNELQNGDINIDFDWARIKKEIFIPIKNGDEIQYSFYNWDQDKITHQVNVLKDRPIIIEGGYSLQPEFFNEYDFTVWIETPEDTRMNRAMIRDGEHMRPHWEKTWLPADKRYKDTHKTYQQVDLSIDGSKSDFVNDLIIIK